mmetsp:Transcript_78830/g.189190  ORF Transcript_78830/g.189190 Transcript_78830/m.189190 type:complete len:318 (+) Transcript_78830:1190-2143(+)
MLRLMAKLQGIFKDLEAELPGGGQNQRVRLARAFEGHLHRTDGFVMLDHACQSWHKKGSGFATASLGAAHDITSCQCSWDGPFLDRRWHRETTLVHVLLQLHRNVPCKPGKEVLEIREASDLVCFRPIHGHRHGVIKTKIFTAAFGFRLTAEGIHLFLASWKDPALFVPLLGGLELPLIAFPALLLLIFPARRCCTPPASPGAIRLLGLGLALRVVPGVPGVVRVTPARPIVCRRLGLGRLRFFALIDARPAGGQGWPESDFLRRVVVPGSKQPELAVFQRAGFVIIQFLAGGSDGLPLDVEDILIPICICPPLRWR